MSLQSGNDAGPCNDRQADVINPYVEAIVSWLLSLG